MRVDIQGDTIAARALRGLLQSQDYHVTKHFPQYSILLTEHTSNGIVLDSVDSALEREILNRITELTERHVTIQRVGGNQSDRHIEIRVPGGDEAASNAVEIGVFRALTKLRGVRSAWRRFFG